MPVYVVKRSGSHEFFGFGHARKIHKLTPPLPTLTIKMDIKTLELRSVIFSLIVFFVSSVRGEIRCFCNQASCVSTGYMCKSSALCFSDMPNGVHGCLDRRRCVGLTCCKEDMCNYLEAEIKHTLSVSMKSSLEDSALDDANSVAVMDDAFNRETWLKASIIAVPVVGVCILAALAAAAAKMLRQDAERQRRLDELRRIYGNSLRDTLLPWSKEKSTTIV